MAHIQDLRIKQYIHKHTVSTFLQMCHAIYFPYILKLNFRLPRS